jgi:hypothetical protein
VLEEHKTENKETVRENIRMGGAIYGSEEWTIGKTDLKRIEGFETWSWRSVLKIKCTEKMRNVEV